MASWRMISTTLLASGLALSASAQVLTPTPPKEERETFTPPPPPKPRPAAPAPSRPQRNQEPGSNLPELDYDPMTRPLGTDESYDGPVPRYDIDLVYTALKHNPTIDASVESIMSDYVESRYRKLETRVIENLGGVLDIEDGALAGLQWSVDKTVVAENQRITDSLIKPIKLELNILQEMSRAAVLSPIQIRFNQKIQREYQTALFGEIQATFGAEDPDAAGHELIQELARVETLEATDAYNQLLFEATTRMADVVEGIDLPDAVRTALLDLQGPDLDDDAQRDERVEALKLTWRPLSLEQKQSLLNAAVATRSEGRHIPRFAITYEGKPYADPETYARSARRPFRNAANPGGDGVAGGKLNLQTTDPNKEGPGG